MHARVFAETTTVGIVVIGRNEGERLLGCIASVGELGVPYVYVDSGSTDDSIGNAAQLGADVVALDAHAPFTAARGRNAGFRFLRKKYPNLTYVQFVDGDCELASGWMPAALEFLEKHRDVAVVCGQLKERHPEASLYNRLCETEWAGPTGQIRTSGGIALIRVESFHEVGEFREDLISGEEPELCFRLRSRGWKIWRLPVHMAWHDANMTQFGQWWRRMARNGHGCARGMFYYEKASPERRECVRRVAGALAWGAVLPLAVLVCAAMWPPGVFLGLALYPLQILRLRVRGAGDANVSPWTSASFTVLDKFPHVAGILRFTIHRFLKRETALIEYK